MKGLSGAAVTHVERLIAKDKAEVQRMVGD
jgi:hypothetical protein